MVRRFPLVLVALLATSLLGVPVAGAEEPPPAEPAATGPAPGAAATEPAPTGEPAADGSTTDPGSVVDPRIVGGTPASTATYPWMVSIQVRGTRAAHFCGGSLISPSWVLTAAHCAQGRTTANTAVVLGRDTRSAMTLADQRFIDAIVINPAFRSSTLEHDAALLHLSTPATGFATVALTAGASDAPPGTFLRIIGWGTTSSGGSGSNQLLQADVEVQTDTVCSASYGSEYFSASMLCAGPLAGGTDTCQGDSGGPAAASVAGEWRLVGITSWGNGCALPGFPGVYTRVTAETAWVNSVLTAAPVPTVTALAPAKGGVGTVVTLTGTNLTGATEVRFNTTVATVFTVVSATSIRATVPSGATTGNVTVVTPAGTATGPRFTLTSGTGGGTKPR